MLLFQQNFKDKYGVSPTQYRKEGTKNDCVKNAKNILPTKNIYYI